MSWSDNKLISLNSKFATKLNGSMLSNVVFPFSGILKSESNMKHVYISVMSAQFPVSFYVINSTNNILKVISGTTFLGYTLTLTYGNYNLNTLITEINSKFSSVGFPSNPTITQNKSTGKLTFAFSSNNTILASQSTIRDVLGLGTSDLTGSSITAPYPFNLLGIKLLNIASNALSVNSINSATGSNSSILATIPNDVPFFNQISYVNQNDLNRFELNVDYVNSIDIQIYDENGNFIDFNNTNWTMTIIMTIERYDLEPINNDLEKSLISHNIQSQEHFTSESQLTQDLKSQEEEKQEIDLVDDIRKDENVETQEEKEDDILTQLINGASSYSTKVKNIIKEYGDDIVEGIILKRSPITSAIYHAMNAFSLGKFDASNPYDKLYHLSMDVHLGSGKVIKVEKNATINMDLDPIDKKDTESLVVSNVPQISFNILLANGQKRMGKKYFYYNAKSNNCQDYILNLFEASNIGSHGDKEFIKQSIRDIFNKNPKYLKTMTQLITNLGGRADILKSELDKHKDELNLLLK